MSDIEKNKSEQKTSNQMFGEHIRQFLYKNNVQKSVLHVQICFLPFRSFDFVAVLFAVAFKHYAIVFFCL